MLIVGQIFTTSLDVPSTLKAGTATIRVRFIDSSGQTPSTGRATDVTVSSKSHSLFIQTDKSLYKPSQTGELNHFMFIKVTEKQALIK